MMFVCSMGMVYVAHIIGYADHFLVSISETVFFDGYQPQDFSFVEHQRYLYEVIFRRGRFPPVPSQ